MDYSELWGLFFSGFISSTLLPGGSELLLGYLVHQNLYPAWQLIASATIGNTLGGVVTLLMGLILALRWPVRQPDGRWQKKALELIQKYGVVTLLFSWLPVIGDPLCFIAGWLRLNLTLSVLLILTGKAVRYLLIVAMIS